MSNEITAHEELQAVFRAVFPFGQELDDSHHLIVPHNLVRAVIAEAAAVSAQAAELARLRQDLDDAERIIATDVRLVASLAMIKQARHKATTPQLAGPLLPPKAESKI